MAPYEVQFRASAAKEFRKLTLDIRGRLQKAIDGLKTEPRPAATKKLAGEASLYRIRVGDYRVIYEIDDTNQLIVVTRVRHRRDVYQ
ncbi:type II toxin-antitoxin system RelE/ParE family toxin [Nodosilinea sp. LEGE 06152]|uniref:type II toxin-antitoxin system RelE family toxin n=1 Tax=Nodosilinea sp. LEGE 06152 TaxID=2777966 RepID=UPI0018806859|nr:type II toxin-antitoxin system RelE/ParE family toxin [Nodosilinea sp. LEGE 06152]MBE9155424.1 type II toxin-antitoxin system RelE/ParE family toxin [Nodosilinea sp. LEGE 06152]